MEKIKGILLSGRSYLKKDNVTNGLAINVLVNCDDLSNARVVNLFSGNDYVGNFDLSKYKPLDEIVIEYKQEIGSQYPKLVNFSKVEKK